MTDYDAVVYDLDGTLVRLAVDWGRLEAELADHAADAGIDPEGMTGWEILDAGAAAGVGDDLEAITADAEREGARNSERLPLADELLAEERPAAVCSLNCEAACRTALEEHGLLDAVEAVVGRDSVATRKPEPEPLLAAVEALGVEPGAAVFVGDSERDERTAERAGTGFRYVEGERPH